MGFAMLGAIDLTRIQIWANKIPVSEKFPAFGVLTMGVVSGLVSAPCTGPVLSTLLLLITQTKDPFLGFILMFFFALGFGAPYIALGFVSQKIGRLPKAGNIMKAVKFTFAALMFGLALYFLRPVFTKIDMLVFLYAMPTKLVAGFVSTILVLALLATRFFPQFNAFSNFVALWSLSTGALWFTLSLTNAFESPSVTNTLFGDKIPDAANPNRTQSEIIAWEKDWKKATQRAYLEQKPLLVDVWAKWCVACIKMDKTVWVDPVVVSRVAKSYVAVKLDFTESTPFLEELIAKWELSGLPAVGFFKAGANLNAQPQVLFREAITAEQFVSSSDEILK
jgi:thioredoxin:protein disulfide reductase